MVGRCAGLSSRVGLGCGLTIALSIGCTAATGARSPDADPGAQAQQRPQSPPAPDPKDPDWQEIKVAADCVVRVARQPQALALPFTWEPCADGAPGCTRAQPKEQPATVRVENLIEGAKAKGEVHLVVHESLPGPRHRVLVAPLDGKPLLAFEGPRIETCSLGPVKISDDGAMVEVLYDFADGYASSAFLSGPLAPSSSWAQVSARLLRADFPDLIREDFARVGARLVVLANGGPLLAYDRRDDAWREVKLPRRGWACCFESTAGLATVMLESIPERVFGVRVGESMQALVEPAQGSGMSGLSFDDGRAYWVQGQGRDNNNIYQGLTLMRGSVALTPDVAIDNPTRVAELAGQTMTRPIAGGGLVLVPSFNMKAGNLVPGHPTLFRGADGSGVPLPDFPAELEGSPAGVLRWEWLSSNEVGVLIGATGNSRGTIGGPSELRRYRLKDVAGEPSVDAQTQRR